MAEDFDFDKIVDRRGSGCMKWDEHPDALPLWVADMDFRTAPCVIEALRRRVDHGVFGYTLVDDGYYKALTGWFGSHHGYSFSREDVMYVPGVVPALSAIIKALVPVGAGVIVQTPVYNCFFSSIRNNGCRIVENPLLRRDISESMFTYEMDFDGLERLAADPANRMLLLCNPHNPAGRVWRRDELERVAEICRRHGVRVVSDEIHCELTMPGVSYESFGRVDPEAIVCLSPSKAFNTAGLQIANIIATNSDDRRLIDRAININEVCDVNPFGVTALKAAYSDAGAEWLDALRRYLHANYLFLRDRLGQRLPQCPVVKLEGTYLPWIDVTALGVGGATAAGRLLDEAGVWVNPGSMYGDKNYIRINIACPRATLEEGLRRICDLLNPLLSRKRLG